MKMEMLIMTEYEQEVIEAAIDYVQNLQNGLYRDMPELQRCLKVAVQDLLTENEGRWPAE